MTRYIIIGAGAVGGTIGARLFEAGHDVVLVARGAHSHAIPAPANETLQRLTVAHAREHRLPGNLTITELTALIDQATEAAPSR